MVKKLSEMTWQRKFDEQENNFLVVKENFETAYRSGNIQKLLDASQEMAKICRQRIALNKRMPSMRTAKGRKSWKQPGQYVDFVDQFGHKSMLSKKLKGSKIR